MKFSNLVKCFILMSFAIFGVLVCDAGNSFAQTTSGTLTEDETWSGIVTITGDVRVPDEITLTIDPGTVVKFTALGDDTHSGADASRCELIIDQGVLTAEGESGNEIIFTSTSTLPAMRDWYGIRFVNSYDPFCVMNYCDIQWAYSGVSLQSSSPAILNCLIANNHYRGITGSPSAFNLTIEGSEVHTNGSSSDGHGIYIQCPSEVTVTLEANEVHDNYNRGIYCEHSGANNTELFLIDNVTFDNGDDGVYLRDYYTRESDISVQNLISYGNGGNGIESYVDYYGSNYESRISLYNCEIYANASYGLYANVLSGTKFSCTKSVIYENDNHGVYFRRGQGTFIHNSIHTNEGYGAFFTGCGTVGGFYYNNVYGNDNYEFYNDSSYAVDARYCWWGADATAEMNANGYSSPVTRIHDIHDDENKGVVDWRGHQAAEIDTSKDPMSFIIDPMDGDSFPPGIITVNGLAQAAAGVFWVDVVIDGGGGEPANGQESWTYLWLADIEGSYTLQSRVTDYDLNMEVPYAGAVVDIDETAVHNWGALSGDETWSGDILVTGDVVVPPNISLTILPGTTVTFTAHRDDTLSGADTSRCELRVEGILIADGEPGNEITFTTDQAFPNSRDWYGIRFLSSDDDLCMLDNCDIQWAYAGITLTNASPSIKNSVIANHRYRGITGRSSDEDITIMGNEVFDCGSNSDGHGIYVETPGDTAVFLDGNYIHDNYRQGISCLHSGADYGEFFITNNTVHENGDDGIYLREYYSRNVFATLQSNTVSNNSGNGIELSCDSYGSGYHVDFEIDDCEIYSNSANGLRISAMSETRVRCTNTSIHHNQNHGIYMNSGLGLFFQNDVYDNADYGALLSASVGVHRFYCSNIYGNDTYEMYNDCSYAVDARNCWWGSLTTAQMNAWGYSADIWLLYDIHDYYTKGMIDYRGWKATPVDTSKELVSYIIDPMHGMTLPMGDVSVKGIARGYSGIMLVDISTDGGSSWAPALGRESWRHTWYPSAAGTYNLLSRAQGNDYNVEIPGPGVTVEIDDGLIHAWGTLHSDEVWSGIVVVTGDVIVPEGLTLTIMPGTYVLFTALRDDAISGLDTSRCELIVYGTLIADGAPENEIVFRSEETFPEKKDWYGIRFVNSNDDLCVIDHCDIQWAHIGISLEDSSPLITGTRIGNHWYRGISGRHSLHDFYMAGNEIFECGSNSNGYGIYLEGRSETLATLEGNHVHHNYHTGINCDQSGLNYPQLLILDNTCNDNGDDGIYARVYYTRNSSATLSGNFSYNNAGDGLQIYADNYGSGYYLDIEADWNDFYMNGSSGMNVNVRYQATLTATGNVSHYNEEYGLYFKGGVGTFSFNHIYWNENCGVRFDDTAALTIFNNNEMYNNETYEMYNNSGQAVTAQYCWWGAQATAQMDAYGYPYNIERIYDIHDNASRGQVDYRYWQAGVLPSITPTSGPSATPGPPTATPTITPTGEPPTATPVTPTATPEPTATITPTLICWNDGDLDDNGRLTPQDAQIAFDIYLESITDPTHDELCSADCNADWDVTPADVQCIFQHYLELDCDCVDPVQKTGKSGEYLERLAASDQSGALLDRYTKSVQNEKIRTPSEGLLFVDLVYDEDSNAALLKIAITPLEKPVDAFGLTLNLPGNISEISSGEFAENIAGWAFTGLEHHGDKIIVGAFDPDSELAPGKEWMIALIAFHTKDKAEITDHEFKVTAEDLVDDIEGFETVCNSSRNEIGSLGGNPLYRED